eukprot:gene20307-27063_t
MDVANEHVLKPISAPSGSTLIARGFPEDMRGKHGIGPSASAFIQSMGGPAAFSSSDPASCTTVRCSSKPLHPWDSKSTESGGGQSKAGPGRPMLTSISTRSSAVGLLNNTVEKASAICSAGAYMHWYEKYGCGPDALETAIQQIADVVDCYRAAHGTT